MAAHALAAHGWLMPTTIESAPSVRTRSGRRRRSRNQAGCGAARLVQLRVDVLDAAGRRARHARHRCRPRSHVTWCSKDAPAFNILFEGTCPRLVDVLSLEPYQPGALWAGYTQFCRSFLAPLLITAHTGWPFQPLLRGAPRRAAARRRRTAARVDTRAPTRRRARTSCCKAGWNRASDSAPDDVKQRDGGSRTPEERSS